MGVLRNGRPVAGAIFTPESAPKFSTGEGGVIYRAWEGGGAYRGDRPIEVAGDDKPTGKRIASLPGAYWMQFRPTGPLLSRPPTAAHPRPQKGLLSSFGILRCFKTKSPPIVRPHKYATFHHTWRRRNRRPERPAPPAFARSGIQDVQTPVASAN